VVDRNGENTGVSTTPSGDMTSSGEAGLYPRGRPKEANASDGYGRLDADRSKRSFMDENAISDDDRGCPSDAREGEIGLHWPLMAQYKWLGTLGIYLEEPITGPRGRNTGGHTRTSTHSANSRDWGGSIKKSAKSQKNITCLRSLPPDLQRCSIRKRFGALSGTLPCCSAL